MASLNAIIHSLVFPILIALLFGAPLSVVVVLFVRRKRAYESQAAEPFTSLPLRPPGESLRLKIDALSEKLDEHLFVAAMVAAVGTVATVTAPESSRVLFGSVFLAASIAVAIWKGGKILGIANQLWNYRLGFTGERVVGEELNQLLASGFRVFHDVPFDTFNIDHVLVGPPGVYAVETKARRKPKDLKGAAKANVVFDGTSLQFPRHRDTRSLEQALRNARALAEWLTQSTGERVYVNPVLTLPGWFVDRKAKGDVNVLNPDEIKRSFPNRPLQPLSSEQIQRIAHQLTERCRITTQE